MAVVKANYVRKGIGERETAKANIRYIQERPSRDKEKLTRPLFNNAGFLGRLEAYQFIDEGFPIVLAKFTLLRNYTFFHNEF